ncbi:MAG: PAS domain S-box protein [Chloroflexaceae bacterium]|nr:PAS domain S-box protein [Chloroflexaceae bacterium]
MNDDCADYQAVVTDLRQHIAALEQQLHRRESERQRLQAENQQLRMLAAYSYDWHYWLDPALKMVAVSPACERMTGYTPAAFLADANLLTRLIHPDDRDRVTDALMQAVHQQQPATTEFRMMMRDGQQRWIGQVSQPAYDDQGQWCGQCVSNRDITEQVQTCESYRLLVEQTNQPLMIVQDRRVVFANPAAGCLLGGSVQDLLAWSWDDLTALIPTPHDLSLVQYVALIESGENLAPVSNQWYIQHQDGQQHFFELMLCSTLYAGRPALQLSLLDMTEHQWAETLRKASEEQFRCFFEQSYDALALMDETCLVMEWSRGAEQLYGLKREDVVGTMRWEEASGLLPAECEDPDVYEQIQADVFEIIELARRASSYGWPGDWFRRVVQRRDGTWRTVSTHLFPIRLDQDVWLGSITRDITSQAGIEQTLRESQQFIQRVADTMPGILYVYDMEQQCDMYVNRAVTTLLGYPLHELQAMHTGFIAALVHPDDLARTDATWQRYDCITDGQVVISTYRMRHTNGTWRWFEIQSTILSRRTDGKPRQVLGVAHDVTERKQTEEALRQSEERYRSLVENIHDVVFSLDQRGNLSYISPSIERISDYDVSSMIGRPLTDFVYPDDIPQLQASLARTRDGDPHPTEFRILSGEGQFCYVRIWACLMHHEEHGTSMTGVMTDITENKLAETQLQEINTQLIRWVQTLEQRDYEAMILTRMADLLQSCVTVEEAYEVVALVAERLFPTQSGALYIYGAETDSFTIVSRWGIAPPQEPIHGSRDCRALQQGHSYLAFATGNRLWCHHVSRSESSSSLCVLLVAQAETLGLLHLRNGPTEDHEARRRWQQVAEIVAGHTALALTNLRLRLRLQEQATRDSLTGLFNRRYLDETLKRELKRAVRYSHPLSIIMLDIDYFKYFNDTYGHDAGDTLLRAVGDFLRAQTRTEDIACRYGGEEFTLVLPGATLDDTYQRAEQMRMGIKRLHVHHQGKPLETITVSLGIATFPLHGMSEDTLIQTADKALYRAKAEGRDRVKVADVMPFRPNAGRVNGEHHVMC